MLTCYSILPWMLLVIHTCYELALAMVSFINMPACCGYACFVMQGFLMSVLSSQRCLHNSVYGMLCFSAKSETVNKTCYVYMGAIISSVLFWLMISKGILFYAFSRFMPCLDLLGYVPITCCLLALNMASWCYFWHVSNFSKSVKLISFALLTCLFEPALVWFSRSSLFMFCQASLVHNCHMPCWYVGVQ